MPQHGGKPRSLASSCGCPPRERSTARSSSAPVATAGALSCGSGCPGASWVQGHGVHFVARAAKWGLELACVDEPSVADELARGELRVILPHYAFHVPGFLLYYSPAWRASPQRPTFIAAARNWGEAPAEGRGLSITRPRTAELNWDPRTIFPCDARVPIGNNASSSVPRHNQVRMSNRSPQNQSTK